jgi:beta-1,2-rhamnosyltransferase WsaF-like protein
MKKNRKIDILALRSLRKTARISAQAMIKSGTFMHRVEHKTSKLIINKAGSDSGENSVGIDEFMFSALPYISPIHPALPEIGQQPSVTVLVPSLTPRGFYGGIATLLITSALLAKKMNYNYRVVQTSGFEKNNSVLEFLASNGIEIEESRFSTVDVSFRSPFRFAYLSLHPKDVVVVSAWWDAAVASMLPLKRKFIYMIQDHEPIFYSNSDLQQFAEQTYHSDNFIPLCNTELLLSYFKKGNEYPYIAKNATFFEPAVAVKRKSTEKNNSVAKYRKVFLYGRPNVERNLFYSAVKALDKAMSDERLKDLTWEIFSAGQADIPSIKLHNGTVINNLGKMSYEEYYKFAQSVNIAISPMLAPHPNYPTLELASIGSMVVSTKYMTKQSLDRYSKNILMAEPNVADMAEKIITAALFDKRAQQQNIKENDILTDWTQALDKPLDAIVKKIEQL